MTTWKEAQANELSFWMSFFTQELRAPSRDFVLGYRMAESWLHFQALGYGWIVKRNSSDENPLRGKVLDVGCGPISVLEHGLGYDVVGIDPLMAKYAQAMPDFVRLGFVNNAEYRSGTIADVAEQDFDFVWCVNVLDHLDNWSETVGHFARVLKPGGTLMLSTDIRKVTDQYHIGTFNYLDLVTRLQQVGFFTLHTSGGNDTAPVYRVNITAIKPVPL